MADRYLLESGAPDGYLLEDGSGVLLLEAGAADMPNTALLSTIEEGQLAITAAGLGGVLQA